MELNSNNDAALLNMTACFYRRLFILLIIFTFYFLDNNQQLCFLSDSDRTETPQKDIIVQLHDRLNAF